MDNPKTSGLIRGSRLRVRLRDGRVFEAIVQREVAYPYGRIADEIAGTIDTISFQWRRIATISFKGEVGRLRYDAATGTWWPADYNYNPVTGSKLTWRTPVPVKKKAKAKK